MFLQCEFHPEEKILSKNSWFRYIEKLPRNEAAAAAAAVAAVAAVAAALG